MYLKRHYAGNVMQISGLSLQPLFGVLSAVYHADLWLREEHNLLTPIWQIFSIVVSCGMRQEIE